MSQHKLHLSDDLSLPVDAATQTFAFVARKGAGKTYAAGKLNELLIDAGVQCVILDTVGNWYGLRISADGKGNGFDVPVLGGLRGDIPLEPTGGELVADLVADTGRSVIVDVSQFSQADRKRFATAFAKRLWQRKKSESNPTPLFITLEEAQLIVPQMVRGDDAAMVGIWEEIIRLGRNYGIGVAMITQRPQSVNKEVLTQTECLVVLQVNGAPERKALKDWIVHQGMDTHLVDELPTLPIGTAYIWSPQWLGILQKVKIAKKKTFDASATPKVGEKRLQRELAPLDLEAFKSKMSATIEKAKENDVGHLKRTIAELKRDLHKAQTAKPAEIKTKEVPILEPKLIQQIKEVWDHRAEAMRHLTTTTDVMRSVFNALHKFEKHPARLTPANFPPGGEKHAGQNTSMPARVMPRAIQRANAVPTNGEISGGMRRMMVALAQRSPLSKRQLGVRAGLSSTSGTFGTYLGRLRSAGYVDGEGDNLALTDAGRSALGNYDPLPEGRDLLAYWLDQLGSGGAGRMLQVLAENYPTPVSKEVLGNLANISHTSGTFGTYLGKLRTLELIEGRGELLASREFFE